MAVRPASSTRMAAPQAPECAVNDYGKPTFQPGSYVYEVSPSGGTNKFRVGRLLGRGGFAKCYEVTDATGSYALKAVNRTSLEKPKTLQKLQSEIAIHRRMKHRYIVNFVRTFKDRYYVYILLEKCDNGTLMDMLKVRPLTVPETQFIMIQCLTAMQYMHDQRVIHRDLKPGNIMLDCEVNVKIGDFGLAAELQFDGDRKRTVCGTPNYIAPEIIDKRSHGHSYEVDTWSLGVILYTLLTGQPPFQMEDVESTYNRIRQCRYDFPSSVPENARDLIRQILQSSPTHRPTLMDIRTHPFFSFPSPPISPPASFEAFGIVFGERARRASAPVSGSCGLDVNNNDNNNNNNQSPYMRVPPAQRVNYYAKDQQREREREALRPISANAPPPHGAPTSPRMMYPPAAMGARQLQQRVVASAGAAGTGAGNLYRAQNYVQTDAASLQTAAARVLQEKERMLAEAPVRQSSERRVPLAAGDLNGGALLPDSGAPQRYQTDDEDRQQFTVLHDQLEETLNNGVGTNTAGLSASLPGPEAWVTECADFSEKYGMCYKLSTGHTGAHFNDSTKMVWQPVTGRVEYYDRVKVEMPGEDGEPVVYARDKLEIFNIGEHSAALEKKVTLIKYFKSYLGRTRNARDKVDVVSCSPYVTPMPSRLSDPHVSDDFVYVKRWLRVPEALIFRLSNKTVQVCFEDKAEVILSSEWRVVTYTDPSGCRRTLDLNAASSESEETANRLRRTRKILYQLVKDQHL